MATTSQFDLDLRFNIRKNRVAKVRSWFETHSITPSLGQEDCLDSPLVYAVLWKKPDVVAYLIHERSMRIPMPHPSSCVCQLCILLSNDRRFAQVYTRRVLMALVSPIYIFSLNEDPLDYYLECFRRIAELRYTLMRHSRSHFRLLRKSVENSISALMDCCENYEEVQTVLIDEIDHGLLQGLENFEPRLGRVQLFLEMKLRSPAVHRATQSLVNNVWMYDLPWLQRIRSPMLQSMLLYLTSLFCFAIISPLVILFPHPKLVGLIKARPVASVLELISTYANVASVLVTVLQNLSSSSNLCSVWTTGSMAAVYASYSIMSSFIIGRICREAHDMFWLGPGLNHINMFDRCLSISNAFQLAGVVTLLTGVTRVRNNHPTDDVVQKAVLNLCNVPNATYPQGQEICQLHTCMTDSEIRYIAEWTVPERLGSSLLSIGHLLLFLSLGNAFEMHKITGVLTFTVQKMFKDIGQFFVFMALVLLGFGSALTTMYQNFRCNTTPFDSFPNTTNVLYWGIYAMSDITAYQLASNKLSRDSVTQFVSNFGLFLFGGYILIASVVAVNLLIALMSVTFEDIQANKNDKWLFGRMRRQLKLILLRPYHSLVLPIPLNLLTPLPQTTLAIARGIWWILRRCITACSRKSNSSLQLQLEQQQPEKELEEIRAADLQYITSHVQRRTTIEKCLVKLRIKYKLCEYSKEALKANRLSLSMLEDQEELFEMEEEEEDDEED